MPQVHQDQLAAPRASNAASDHSNACVGYASVTLAAMRIVRIADLSAQGHGQISYASSSSEAAMNDDLWFTPSAVSSEVELTIRKRGWFKGSAAEALTTGLVSFPSSLYVNGTSGQIGTTPGTYSRKIGTAFALDEVFLCTDGGFGSPLISSPIVVPMLVGGQWQVDADLALTNGGGHLPVPTTSAGSEVTLTEAAAAYAVVSDGGVLALLSVGGATYTGAYQLFPDAPVTAVDYVAFGKTIPFDEIAIDMSATVQTYTGDGVKWQYVSAAGPTWSDLTVHDNTDATARTGLRAFGRDGSITFQPPADWTSVSLNGTTAYWIRSVVTTAANINVKGLTATKKHQFVTAARPFTFPYSGIITGYRLMDQATTLHTTADVKFHLINETTGAYTAVQTFAQDRRTHVATGLSLAFAAGEGIAVVVTQEDGTNEVLDGILELVVTRT